MCERIFKAHILCALLVFDMAAFVSGCGFGLVASTKSSATCVVPKYDGFRVVSAGEDSTRAVSGVVMMACRRNLKYEKRLRNSEYARQHRQKTVRVNRRAEVQEKNDSDALYLSGLFKTLNFGGQEEQGQDDRRSDRRQPRQQQ